MGEVVEVDFSKPRPALHGFIPDGIGMMALEELERQRRARLIEFAKLGQPPPINPY